MNPSIKTMRSPFEGISPAEKPNRQGKVGLNFQPRLLTSLMLLGTWVGAGETLAAHLSAHFGTSVPALTGGTLQHQDTLLMRVGPEEFWALESKQPDGGKAWRAFLPGDVGTVSDLSHARCAVTVSGSACLALFSKLYALDCSEAKFPVGQIRYSTHHHVPCVLHRLAPDRFDVYVFTTYAYDALGSMLDAGQEYGTHLHPVTGI